MFESTQPTLARLGRPAQNSAAGRPGAGVLHPARGELKVADTNEHCGGVSDGPSLPFGSPRAHRTTWTRSAARSVLTKARGASIGAGLSQSRPTKQTSRRLEASSSDRRAPSELRSFHAARPSFLFCFVWFFFWVLPFVACNGTWAWHEASGTMWSGPMVASHKAGSTNRLAILQKSNLNPIRQEARGLLQHRGASCLSKLSTPTKKKAT